MWRSSFEARTKRVASFRSSLFFVEHTSHALPSTRCEWPLPGRRQEASGQKVVRDILEHDDRGRSPHQHPIRELGEGGVWRSIDGEPTPVSVLMCDIRRGRSAELRMEVAKALCKDCIDVLGLREDRLNVEFTQHAGDEMYHPTLGGYSPEWSNEEV